MHSLAWFEQTAFSVWVREEWWVFHTILSIHSIGMGLSAGANLAIALRLYGFAPAIALQGLAKFIPFVWFGFAINVVSGLALLAGYPAKALTNWVFYFKLVLLATALPYMMRVARTLLTDTEPTPELIRAARRAATITVVLWLGVIFTGRFLAYTHSILLAYWET